METKIIDGKEAAAKLRDEIAVQVKTLPCAPGLAVILVGDDPASQVYVRNKIKACEKTGITSFEHRMSENATQQEIRHVIKNLNTNTDIHGILLQLPLPAHLNGDELIQEIDPAKDVDGLTIANIGKLVAGLPGMTPCTPQGSLLLIKSVQEDLTGLHAVIIGRSLLFGKPMAQLLLAENCTVTQCHSKTRDLPGICSQADILIAAVGRAQMVKGDWIKPGAIVIDVGINRVPPPSPPPSGGEHKGGLLGDVDFDSTQGIARAITPVPGGVGPMTIACLLKNTVKAAQSCWEEPER